MNYTLPPPGSPEDARQLRQMLERLLGDIDRLWVRTVPSQNNWNGQPIPGREFELPPPEEPENPENPEGPEE